MPIKIDENRTPAYIGTFEYEDANDMLQLAEVKKMVSNMNKMLRNSKFNYQFRVKLQGRLGENNPNAVKYHTGLWNSHQCIRLKDASRVDAYIYRRRD